MKTTLRGQELKHVSGADRRKMALSRALNRFWRRQGDNREQAKVGPGCCRHCGREPCGGGWGILFGEESARCCSHCTHGVLESESWKPTHVIWYDKKAFFVREQPVGRGGAVYLRQDGVVWFVRIAETFLFLGRPLGTAEFARFAISDPNGWPHGVKGADVGIGRKRPRATADEPVDEAAGDEAAGDEAAAEEAGDEADESDERDESGEDADGELGEEDDDGDDDEESDETDGDDEDAQGDDEGSGGDEQDGEPRGGARQDERRASRWPLAAVRARRRV